MRDAHGVRILLYLTMGWSCLIHNLKSYSKLATPKLKQVKILNSKKV